MNRMGQAGSFLFMLDYELKKPLLLPLTEAAKQGIFFDFQGMANCGPRKKSNNDAFLKKSPVPFEQYKSSFNIVMDNLQYGNSFLVNLTMPTEIQTNLTLEDIFNTNRQPFRLLKKNELVVFSPELFVEIRGNRISSRPMKGTIDAAIPNAKSTLLNDPKEMAEHATIVDLIRNDLSIVANHVRIDDYRYVEKIKTNEKDLLQVSTSISGALTADWKHRIGDILIPLLPAGSISGAPKPQTIKIIAEAEGQERGYYTGIMGAFDGEQLISAVMIRFVEEKEGKMIYRSGGGITSQSNAESEYKEMIDKVYLPR